MADSKELQTQLQINEQINKVLADRSKQMAAMGSQLTNQTKLALELCKALNCEDLAGVNDRLTEIKQGFEEAATAAEEAANASSDLGDRGSKGLNNARESSGGFLDSLSGIKAAAIAGGAGFMKAFSGGIGMFKMLAGGVSSVVGNIFSLGTAILSVPFKIIGGFIDMAAAGTGGTDALREAMEDLRDEMGDLSKGEGAAVMKGFENMRSSSSALAKSGMNLGKVFGYGKEGAAAMLKAVSEIAKEAGASFSMMKDQLAESADAAVMLNKGMGMSNKALAEVARRAHNTGQSAREQMVEMGSMALQMGDQFGVSAKTIGKNMSAMMEDVENFGGMSKKELTAAATYMAKLGLEAKDLQGVIDKFDDFESAAGSVSQLNQAFGIQLDTMEMMNAQNPAERIDMMKNAFHEAGKSVEDMTRAEKKLMAEQMGLSVSAMENVLATENMDMSYEDMEAAAEEAEANKKSESDVMKELADSVKKLTQSGEGVSGFFDAFKKGFSKGFAQGEGFQKMLQAIRKSMNVVFKFGKRIGKMFSDFLGKMGLFSSIKKIFDPKAFEELFGAIGDKFQKFFDALTGKGEYSAAQLFEDISKDFAKFFGGPAGEGIAGLKDFFIKMIGVAGDVLASALPYIVEKLADLIQSVADFLADPKAAMDAAGGATEGIGGAFATAFVKIGKALKPVLPKLGKALKDLFGELFAMIGPWLLKGFIAIILLSAAKGIAVGLIKAGGTALILGAIKKLTGLMGKSTGKNTEKELKKASKKSVKKQGGFFKAIGKMIKSIGNIDKKDLIKAGIVLGAMALMFAGGMVLFAGAFRLSYEILKSVDFIGAMKTLVVLTVTMALAAGVGYVASKMKASAFLKAIPGLLALGGLFAVGMIVFAGAIRIAYEIMKPINWSDFGKMMGMVGAAIVATGVFAVVGAVMAKIFPFIVPIGLGLVAAAGLFTVGVFVFAKAIQYVLPKFKEMAKNEKAISFSLEAIITIVKAVAGMGVLGAAFAAIGLFVIVVAAGFKLAAKFFVGAVGDIKTMIDALMKLPITDPKAADDRIQIVSKLAGAMQKIADIGIQAAKMAIVAELLADGGMAEMFKGMNSFLQTISSVIINMVTTIVGLGKGLPKTDQEGIKLIIEVIKAVTALASGMMKPLEIVGKLSSGLFGEDINKTMSAVVGGLEKIMKSIETSLPSLIKIVVNAAKEVGNPAQVKPKADVVTKAMDAVSKFGTSMGEVMKQVPKDSGVIFSDSMKDRMAKMTEKMNGVIGVVKDQIGKLVGGLLTVQINDPDGAIKKMDVITKAIDATAKFAGVIEKISAIKKVNPEGVGPLITNTVKTMKQFLVGKEGSLQTLISDIGAFQINEATLKPINSSVGALQALLGFAEKVSAFEAGGGLGKTDMSVVVTQIVEQAKKSIDALNSLSRDGISADVALTNFAQAIGTGDGKFTISNEPININLSVKVTMNAGQVARVLVNKTAMTTAGGPTLATAEG